ncbi:hypothetical protein ACT89R_01610 [Rhodococcus qingshengii]
MTEQYPAERYPAERYEPRAPSFFTKGDGLVRPRKAQSLEDTRELVSEVFTPIFQTTADQGRLIEGHGEQLANIDEFLGTGVTTPIYASTGGRDLVTFPDTNMQISYADDGKPTRVPAFTQAAERELLKPPPYYGTVDFAFLRGGLDRKTPLEVVRIITGSDTGIFGIASWNLGIYIYDISNAELALLWNSGDIKATLTSQRQRYHIATGMTDQYAQNDHLLAVATLQIAPGQLQTPRSIGCIFQTGVSEEFGTVPQARHAWLNHQSVLPNRVPLSSLGWDRSKLMWAAVGARAT